MSTLPQPPSGLAASLAGRRKTCTVNAAAMVNVTSLAESGTLPVLVTPALGEVHLPSWCAAHRPAVDALLHAQGAVLFRGFEVASVEQFEAVMRSFGERLLDYVYRSTPRTQLAGQVYSSTEYPADRWILQHNENSYATVWPLRIGFHCIRPALQGGATPLADSRRVYQSLDPALKRHFIERGVMYVRNYRDGLDLSWQEAFQTRERSQVERFCAQAGISCEWRDADSLRTRQVCPAVRQHPQTGEPVWFNQAHLFHVSSLGAQLAAQLCSELALADLPRHACYGDGSEIDAAALEEIRAVYAQHRVSFPWRARDVLILDNMLCSHGREPFSGPRQIAVGMAQACRDGRDGRDGQDG
jgi:alpha-ketoglutarate-dependent taurine dioxygenase